VGYEGLYSVADKGGLIRSLPRKDRLGRSIKGGLLKSTPIPSGYLTVVLYKDCKRKTCRVHQIVAAAFIRIRLPGEETRHENGNQIDNDASNLLYGTRADNQQDAIRHGTHSHGSRHGNSVLTENQVREIRLRYAAGGISQRALAKEYNYNQGNLVNIINRKTWRHVA
jgi:hypothetical protein